MVKDNSREQLLLKSYGRAWGVLQILLLINFASKFSTVWEKVQGVAVAIVLVRPRRWTLAVALACRIAATLGKLPFVHDSKNWWLQTDVTLLIFLLKDGRIERETVLKQMSLFYFFAAFWKVNTSFLDPRYSCSSIFMAQLLSAFVPAVSNMPSVAGLVVRTSPALTLAIEFGVATTLWHPPWRRVGVPGAILLHFLIAITPRPNHIVCFGIGCLVRLLLAVDETTDPPFNVLCVALAAAGLVRAFLVEEDAGALGTGWRGVFDPTCEGSGVDSALFVFTFMATIILQKKPLLDSSPRSLGKVGWAMVALSFSYGLGGPMLGVQDLGSANMFSNLRMFGASNHLVAPTAMLDFGGVVRIEDTNSTWMREVVNYPGDLTEALSVQSRQFLASGGHAARYWNVMLGVEDGPRAYPELRSADVAAAVTGRQRRESNDSVYNPYTLPAIDLRRLFKEADGLNEAYFLKFTRLDDRDETWRANATGRTLVYEYDGLGSKTCEDALTHDPCDPDELPFLPPPAWLRQKLLLAMPYPVVQGFDDEMLCFGP